MPWQPPFGPPPPPPRWTPPLYLNKAPVAEPGFDSPAYGAGPVIDGQAVEVVKPKTPLDQIPMQKYSRINPVEFIQHKLTPETIIAAPEVENMRWKFDEPADDYDSELRLFLAFSRDERALIRRFGLDDEVFETEPAYDDDAAERLQLAQHQELEAAIDPRIRAALQLEHTEQTAWAKEQKLEITLSDYMAFPYRRKYVNRGQLTGAERKLHGRLVNIQKRLEESRGGR